MAVYLLTTAIMMPFIGFMVDKYGRKTILVPFLLINGVFGGLCSVANFWDFTGVQGYSGYRDRFILIEDYGFSEFVAGVVIGIQGITIALISLKADKMVRILSERKLISIGFLIHGLAILWLPYKIPFILIAVLLGVFGIGRGLVMPQVNTLVTKLAPENGLGGLVAVFNILRFVGMGTSPIILGSILAFSDLKMVFLFSSSLAIIAFLVGLMAGFKR